MESFGFPTRAPLAIQVMVLGHRLWHILNRRLAAYNYNHTQAAVIMTLLRRPGLIAQDLVGPISVEPPNITRALQALERRGLVERRPHPTDGRASLFTLTPAGVVEASKLARLMHEASAELEADLSPEQRQTLGEALQIISHRIEPTRGAAV